MVADVMRPAAACACMWDGMLLADVDAVLAAADASSAAPSGASAIPAAADGGGMPDDAGGLGAWFPVLRGRDEATIVGCVSRRGVVAARHRASSMAADPATTRVTFTGGGSARATHGATLNLADAVEPSSLTVVPEAPLSQVAASMHALRADHCVVSRGGSLVGVLSKRHVVAFARGQWPPPA